MNMAASVRLGISCVALLLYASGLPMARAQGPTVTFFPQHGLGQFLAENFDLASIRSSFGPRRSREQRTFAHFKLKPSVASDDNVEFESDTWFYQLRVKRRADINGDGVEDLEVCFQDRALGGPTYQSQQGLLITRYSSSQYAVALSFSLDGACNR
jgi:hypothetical protein